MAQKKTAAQKRDSAPQPEVKVLAVQGGPMYPPGRMLIPSPLAIQAQLKTVPEGEFMTVGQLRQNLARLYGADYTCPLTTGIFLRVVAEAAEEEGRTDVPYWRLVRDNGTFLDKLPGGPQAQAARLAGEGLPTKTVRGKTRLDLELLAQR